jgi:arsenate reductase-like glutaredoxin family protein
MSCTKASKVLEAKQTTIKETIPASRKLGRDRALELVGAATRVIVAKGKKVSDFDPKTDDQETIADAMLGPTDNLRAPTLVLGKTVVVGFNDDRYQDLL